MDAALSIKDVTSLSAIRRQINTTDKFELQGWHKAILFIAAMWTIIVVGGNYEGNYGSNRSTSSSPEKAIEKQFSPWDGSHITLTGIIKSRLHDPSSFEQDETKYMTNSDHIFVIQSYRAKNGFGAMRKQTAKAKFDFNGNLIGEVETM